MISTGNPLLAGASGKLDIIVVKQYGDKTVISKKPDMSRRKLSPKQKEANERMRFAIQYAKTIVANPRLKQRACDLLKVEPNKVFRRIVQHFLLTDHLGTSDLFTETDQEKRDQQTLKELKSIIVNEIPDAEVSLFGDKSKGVNNPHSHWDLLVLSNADHSAVVKGELQEKLFIITAQYGVNVNLLLVQKDRWKTGKEFELLRGRIEKELVAV